KAPAGALDMRYDTNLTDIGHMAQYKTLSVIFGVFLWASTLAQPADLPPGLDAYVERVLHEFEVPGLGLAIVKDGQVVLAKGYGVKRLGHTDKVDENTLFSI